MRSLPSLAFVSIMSIMMMLACARSEPEAPVGQPGSPVASTPVDASQPEAGSPAPTPAPEAGGVPVPENPPPEPTPSPEPQLVPSAPKPAFPPITSPVPALPEGTFPGWCSVSQTIEMVEDFGSMADVLRLTNGKPDGTSADLCPVASSCSSCACAAEGPWFVVDHDSLRTFLIVPTGPDRYGRIDELGYQSDGTEESELIIETATDSYDPIDAWVMRDLAEQQCEDDDEPICGLYTTAHVYAVLTGLADGRVLLTEVMIDREVYEGGPPVVELTRDTMVVSACGRKARVPLPPDWVACFDAAERDELGERDEDERAPEGPPAKPASTAQAAQLCGAGWSKLLAGQLDTAAVDIDVALEVLEGATDERGRRSLGACLYNRGRLAEARGQLDEARRLYERSLNVRPNDVVAGRLKGLR